MSRCQIFRCMSYVYIQMLCRRCMFCLCVSVCVFACFNVLRQKGRRWRRIVCVCVYQRKSLFPRPLIIPHPPASLITPRPPAPFLFYIGRLGCPVSTGDVEVQLKVFTYVLYLVFLKYLYKIMTLKLFFRYVFFAVSLLLVLTPAASPEIIFRNLIMFCYFIYIV